MRPCFFYSLLLLVFACKGKQGTDPQTEVLVRDSVVAEPKKEQRYSYYVEDNLFILRDNERKVADTLELEPETYYHKKIVDMTDSLGFANLVLQFDWSAESDFRCSQFIEYNGDSLKLLFEIYYLNEIRRKDANTLAGLVSDRDEVVNDFQDDYPFTVSLKDNKVMYDRPDVQYLGGTSEVLKDFEAYRLGSAGDTIPVVIKKGNSVGIDTFYRATNKLRLLIEKSPPVFINPEKLKDKITTNTAG